MEVKTSAKHPFRTAACHSRATSGGQPRYRADNHGHLHHMNELAVSCSGSENGIPGTCLIRMRSQVQVLQQPWLCLALNVPRDGHVVGDLLRRLRDAKPNVGRYDIIARSKDVPLCLRRSGGRLTGHQWLGQGFQQRPDLGVRVASVAAQGTEIRQPAVLRPATDRLWRHLEDLGDLGCT
jgi:hypothetical protein